MNKYIDAEKLIAELRRQKRELELSIQSQGDYGQSCHIVTYENILSLIDSLQQNQPEVDLENEFADFLEKENAYVDDNNKISYYNGSSFDHTSDIYPIACHFYELGKNSK